MDSKNSKKGPPRTPKRPSKAERQAGKNKAQVGFGSEPWAPPRSGTPDGAETQLAGEDLRNQKGRTAGEQPPRKQFANPKKKLGKDKRAGNSQYYSQRASTGGHFWGQNLQEQPRASATAAVKSRPPKVFKQFGQDEQRSSQAFQGKQHEMRPKNAEPGLPRPQPAGAHHGRAGAGSEPTTQSAKRQRSRGPSANPNEWLKRLVNNLQTHIADRQAKISLKRECTQEEIAAYLNMSIFAQNNDQEAAHESEGETAVDAEAAGLNQSKLEAELIDQIILPYKSHKYSFGDFLASFIAEILKVNDQLQQAIHLRNLGQLTAVTTTTGHQQDTGPGRDLHVDVEVDDLDADGQGEADQLLEESLAVDEEKEERYNILDSFLSGLLVAAFECVLKKRKELLKEMSTEAIKRLCQCLLNTLSYQDAAVLQVYGIIKEKSSAVAEQKEEKNGTKTQADLGQQMISVRSVNDEVYREACLRFLSQVCFENCAYVPDESVANIYRCVSKLAFMHESEDAQKLHANTFKGNNTMFYKTLRAAFNCVANLLVQPDGGNTGSQIAGSTQASQTERTEQATASTFIQLNNGVIFASLRKEFEYLMGKLQSYHRSKRFISQMTTVVRALQCSLNYNSGHSKKHPTAKDKAAQGAPGGLGTGEPGSSPAFLPASIAGKKGKFGAFGAGSQPPTGEIILPDNEAIELFVNFYKLLFLGTKFATKMLKITLNSQAKKIEMPAATGLDATDSEGGSIIMDTSDAMLSPSDAANSAFGKSEGSKHGLLHLVDDSGGDQYHKIKIQATLGLKNLFSNNSKTLFNYWYIMFPSFMMRPQTELSKYLTSFADRASAQQFAAEAFKDIENKEPTIFFVVRQPLAQSQLKCQMLATFQIMLEHSQISKQRQDLEDKSSGQASGYAPSKEYHKTVSLVQMTEVLGQFLRFAHYILICLLHEEAKSAHLYPTSFNNNRTPKNYDAVQGEREVPTHFFDRQSFIQIIRTMKTLVQVTPYSLMRTGLASVMMQALIENLQTLDKINNRDQLIRNEIFVAMNQAMQKSDLIPELKVSFFETTRRSELQDSLINTLFKVNNFISNEKIQILQTLGKNYPEVLTYQWLKIEKGYTVPKIQNFIVQTIQKIDRKKVNLILKIIEDQLKNYQVLNQADNNDEKVLDAEIQEIKQQKLENYQDIMRLSPYDNEVFCMFLFNTIDQSILQHRDLEDDADTNQGLPSRNQAGPQYRRQGPPSTKNALAVNPGQAKPSPHTVGAALLQLGVDINTTISLLNLACIMNQQQFHRVFKTEEQILKLLAFLEHVLNISYAHATPSTAPADPPTNPTVPSILKAAIIKTFGYLIQHKRGSSIFTQDAYVCNTILGHCLSPSILRESNIHVQIRNSWTISFVCSLYPIECLIKSKSLRHEDRQEEMSERTRQEENLMLLIGTCIKYSQHQQSNKEKVAASAIRALGFVAQNLIVLEKKMREPAGGKDGEEQQIAEQAVASGELQLDAEFVQRAVRQIIEVIIGKLYNQRACTPKVLWNICVAISKVIDTFNDAYHIDADQHYTEIDYTKSLMSQIFCFETTQCFLNIFMNGQNYKTKIHACQTLLKYRNLNQYGQLDNQMNPENLLRLFWSHIQEQLKFQINCKNLQIPAYGNTQQSAVEQSAYIEQIDQSFIDFWVHICNLTSKNLLNPCTAPQLAGAELAKYNENTVFIKDSSHHQSVMTAYFNEHALDLLQSIVQYLRRELKVPEYAQMFEFEEGDEFTQEDFAAETKQIFEDRPGLFSKLQKLQRFIIGKIYEIIQQEDSEVRVSFFVFESFAKLAKSDVLAEYRGLEMLRQARSFNPSHL